MLALHKYFSLIMFFPLFLITLLYLRERLLHFWYITENPREIILSLLKIATLKFTMCISTILRIHCQGFRRFEKQARKCKE